MNNIENLFVVASEECAEMQQSISKILRFGERNHHPDRPDDTNAKELLTEYYELQGVMEMIINQGILGHMTEEQIKYIKKNKKRKVSVYAQLSKDLGLIR